MVPILAHLPLQIRIVEYEGERRAASLRQTLQPEGGAEEVALRGKGQKHQILGSDTIGFERLRGMREGGGQTEEIGKLAARRVALENGIGGKGKNRLGGKLMN